MPETKTLFNIYMMTIAALAASTISVLNREAYHPAAPAEPFRPDLSLQTVASKLTRQFPQDPCVQEKQITDPVDLSLVSSTHELNTQTIFSHGNACPAAAPGRGFSQITLPSGQHVGVEFNVNGRKHTVRNVYDLDNPAHQSAFDREVLRAERNERAF
jgi:hypothetical protein